MRSLDCRGVVITGAGSGIGRALALHAAADGARLALCDRDSVGLQATAALIAERHGVQVRTDDCDVGDRAAMKEYAESVSADLGVVNVLVNNAGIALHGDFVDVTYEQLDQIMDVDFWGVVHGTKEFLPHLIASGDGHIVNISSILGLLSVPGQSAYNAAKFAVRGLTEALRQEMKVAGHPVGVTCVHPGGIKTAIARNAQVAGEVDQTGLAAFFDSRLARTTPDDAARVIWDGVFKDKARVLVGIDAQLLHAMTQVLGARYQRLVTASAKHRAGRH